MEVWATKRKLNTLDFVDRLLPPEDLPNLLPEVDYVMLAVPLTKDTRNLIGNAEFDMMKSTARLINICRGAVVDEAALYDALKNNCIRGACIDIFKDEKPLPKNSQFYKLPNLLNSSFSAYYSADSANDQMNVFFDNLDRFINDRMLSKSVDGAQLIRIQKL